MIADFDNTDLFCRINVQADIPFQEFVAVIARCAGGSSHLNTVRDRTFDISVFENDDFDQEKARTGKTRWLHFKYTLELDPRSGVSSAEYQVAIRALLQALWSAQLDAVAACDFEDQLPRNVRWLKWAEAPEPDVRDSHQHSVTTTERSPTTGAADTLVTRIDLSQSGQG